MSTNKLTTYYTTEEEYTGLCLECGTALFPNFWDTCYKCYCSDCEEARRENAK